MVGPEKLEKFFLAVKKELEKSINHIKSYCWDLKKVNGRQTIHLHPKKMSEVLLMNLPFVILIKIFSMLPPKTILQCRCLCKTLMTLLSDDEFVNFHLMRSPTCLLVNNKYSKCPESLFWYTRSKDSHCFSLIELEDEPNCHDLRHAEGSKMRFREDLEENGMVFIGSINGLVCLHESQTLSQSVHVWNPTLREYITLPQNENIRESIVRYGFGFSSTNNHYKVIRIMQETQKVNSSTGNRQRICKSECHVYTLGTGEWRSIGNALFVYSRSDQGIFLNGNLHWLIEDLNGPEFISSLDLETEMFQPFPAPPQLTKKNLATLNLFGEYLSVCDNTSISETVVWVMKEYGVGSSWSKDIIIQKIPNPLAQYFEVVHVIKVFKDGEVLLLWCEDELLLYHPQRRGFKALNVRDLIGEPQPSGNAIRIDEQDEEEEEDEEDDLFPCIDALCYVSSFITLKKVGEKMVYKY